MRCGCELLTGGCKRPYSGWSPPLELKWLATTKSVCPFQVISGEWLAAVGKRAVGRSNASRTVSQGSFPALIDDSVGGVEDRSRAVDKRKATVGAIKERHADVPVGLAAVWLFLGLTSRYWYVGPPALTMAPANWLNVCVAATCELFADRRCLESPKEPEIGCTQVVDRDFGEAGELGRRVGGVEVLDVE